MQDFMEIIHICYIDKKKYIYIYISIYIMLFILCMFYKVPAYLYISTYL